MRNMALKCILRLLELTQKETRADSIQGKQRLLEDFGPGEDASDEEELTVRGKRVKQQQPAEHQALFDGNCDDHFRIGLKITRSVTRMCSTETLLAAVQGCPRASCLHALMPAHVEHASSAVALRMLLRYTASWCFCKIRVKLVSIMLTLLRFMPSCPKLHPDPSCMPAQEAMMLCLVRQNML